MLDVNEEAGELINGVQKCIISQERNPENPIKPSRKVTYP